MDECAYWITLAHLPRWGYQKINQLIVKFFHEEKISIIDFFHLSKKEWKEIYGLDEKSIQNLEEAQKTLANNAFLAEAYLSHGYEIIPLTSPEYPKTLKANLKMTHAPAVLYIKGNKKILQKNSVAIVGSRAASEISLQFTDNIAKNATKQYQIVVSGFAKGVDRQALDSAIKYHGQSIIVLPQGIMTFTSGFAEYYKEIVNGNVLVLSTFFPKLPWSVGLAMARNEIIYGLANAIYVAESSQKGGTWEGVHAGLKRDRTIYVRHADPKEKNANNLLITKGAIPVDFEGNTIEGFLEDIAKLVPKPLAEKNIKDTDLLDENLKKILHDGTFTAKELLNLLNLDWTRQKLSIEIKKLKYVEISTIKRKTVYGLKGAQKQEQGSLFDKDI